MDSNDFMKIDLHCHSEASWDCITKLFNIPHQCIGKGIQVQAITDHNEIWGAQKLKKMVDDEFSGQLNIIVGEEILTDEGEIIGLFLTKKIVAGLTPEETIRQIREQNGLVMIPHGFDPLKRFRLTPEARQRVISEIEIIETFNARVSRTIYNDKAYMWAQENSKLMSGGSDAHRLQDIGEAWVEVPSQPINHPADLMHALKSAKKPKGAWTHPIFAFTKKSWQQIKSRLRFS